MPDYHRPKVAARLLEISEWKLKRWMRSGRVGISKVDGCVWVDVDSARALIDAAKTAPAPAGVSRRPAQAAELERALAFFASPSVTASPHTKRRRAG